MSTSLIRGVDPLGQVRTVAVTEEGEVRVAGISGGPGGGSAGTEYTEGETDTAITGTAVMWEDVGNTLRPISKDTPLPVTIAGLMAAVDELKAKIQALNDRLPSELVEGKLSVNGSDVIQPIVGNVGVVNFPATQPISANQLPLPEGAATNAALQQVRDLIPTTGTKSAANSFPVVLSQDGPFSTNFGLSTEGPADSDTASASFLRLFKRLLQRVTSLLGVMPASLSINGGLKVAINESLPGGENFVGVVGGKTVRAIATFNRPADTIAYTAGDGVSNSITAGAAIEFVNAARVVGGSGLVIAGKLIKSSTTTTNASFRLWLYTANPGVIPSDNAPFAINNINRVIRIGYIDFTSFVAGGDCAESYANPSVSQLAFKLAAGTSLFGILQAMGSYTPTSGEQFYLDLSILQD